MNAIPNLIPARHKNVNRAEVCDQNFIEFVQNWQGSQASVAAPDAPVLPESFCTRHDFVELFDSQLISRHLDLMARVLRVKNKVFYTIGSSGHEGNAMVGAADAAYRSGLPALPQRRVHGRALPQTAWNGSDHGFGAELRGEQGRSGLGRPPQGMGIEAAVGVAADFDHRLASAQGIRHRGGDRAGAAHRPQAADSGRFSIAICSFGDASSAIMPPRRPHSTRRSGRRTRNCRRRYCSCARTMASAFR